ncbi:hypothetical protein FF38_09004 [Lucilia cuprina]|uniref:Uncharacterized protein n=1 Tax=Lucilia cuprina TaxID=7375 RepID=A0A0L0CNI0_LUCCU|nr:hypothetical protein FF38_09004 [Lucilia cuprina]
MLTTLRCVVLAKDCQQLYQSGVFLQGRASSHIESVTITTYRLQILTLYNWILAPKRPDSQPIVNSATAESTGSFFPREEHPVTANLLQQQTDINTGSKFKRLTIGPSLRNAPILNRSKIVNSSTAVSTGSFFPREEHPFAANLLQQQLKILIIKDPNLLSQNVVCSSRKPY